VHFDAVVVAPRRISRLAGHLQSTLTLDAQLLRLNVSMVDTPNRKPIDQLKWFLTDISEAFDFRTLFWFGLSLLFSIFFASLALQQAFSRQYVLQDDARHHVFWMARFVDPELFPRDLIADYFQSIAPAGYAMLYRAMAAVGVNPYLFAKLLPMCLGLITTAFCFAVCMQLLRAPAAGFMASLLLNQSLWMRNGLVSGTPRSFISPLFLAFMFFLLRRSSSDLSAASLRAQIIWIRPGGYRERSKDVTRVSARRADGCLPPRLLELLVDGKSYRNVFCRSLLSDDDVRGTGAADSDACAKPVSPDETDNEWDRALTQNHSCLSCDVLCG